MLCCHFATPKSSDLPAQCSLALLRDLDSRQTQKYELDEKESKKKESNVVYRLLVLWMTTEERAASPSRLPVVVVVMVVMMVMMVMVMVIVVVVTISPTLQLQLTAVQARLWLLVEAQLSPKA